MNGSLAGNVVNNSALVFANPFAQTYGGVISGNGSLTKSGTGLLLITADQTYTGPTNINAGLVRLAPTTTITVSGFGANTNGTTGSNATWTINTNTGAYITTPVTGGTLTLTDNSGNEERSAFYNTVVPVGAFTASFIYQAGGSLGADGAAFMLQNDPRGLTALGGYGGGFGYGTANGGSPITPSAGIGLNIYSGANSGNGLYFLQGGLVVTTTSTSPVSLGFGDPINVSLSYDGSNTLAVAMTDATLSESYSASYPIGNLASLVGGNTAYLGFSGATGGEESTQTISNFTITTQGLKQALPPTSPLFIASGGTLDLYGCTQAVGDLSGSGMVTNTAAGTAASLNTGGDNTTQTYAGVIADNAGTVALIKSGLGGLTLTGTNRYSGGTTIVAGTLQLGNSAAMGTGALAADGGVLDLSGYSVTVPSFSGASGTVTNSGSNLVTLTVSQSATTTFGGSISDGTGPVGLKLTGSGGLYLTGSNAYSGPTTINAGLLLAAAPGALSPSSAVNITGGTLDVTAAAQTIAALAVGKSGALNLSIGNLLSSNGTVAFASGSTLNILGSIIFLPDVLISYSGAANGTFTKVNYDGAPLPNSDLSYSNGLLQIVNYSAGPPSWIAGSDVWSNGANWSGGSSPSGVGLGALLNQTTSGTAAITLDVPVTLGTLQFGNSAGLRTNYLLGGNLLTFNNNGATASVTVLGGTHTIAAPVLIQSGNLDIVASNSGSLSISGNIADDNGQRSLMLDGDGTGELILSGTNSYGGGTIVNAGTLIAASATALADGSSLTVGQGASSLFAPAVAVAGPSAAAPAGVVAVPEPGTLWLLFVALWSAKACLRFSKRSPLCYTARGMK
jgi:autotransporter-associated beta strand protein